MKHWLRKRSSFMVWLGTAGFAAGFFVFRYGEAQIAWFLLLGVLPMLLWHRRRLGHVLTSQPLPAVLLGGALCMLATSIFVLEDPLPEKPKVIMALANLVLLPAFFAAAPLALARHGNRTEWLLRGIVLLAAFSTLISFVVHYGIRRAPFPEGRFRNIFVYADGLNPVLTGLSCGFAAVIALTLARRSLRSPAFWTWMGAAFVLTGGVFYSGSRGAMLATAAGTLVVIGTSTHRLRWRMLAPLLAAGLVYGAGLLGQNPSHLRELISRGDSGRMAIYTALSKRMVEPGQVLFGHGLWAEESLPAEEAGSMAFHAHSMYASTFYHCGLVGAIWLFAVLGLGLERAWAVWWRSGDPIWLALLAFGMFGLLCDGTLPFRLMTITRIEPLLILFPLAFSSAIAANLNRERRRERRLRTSLALPDLGDSAVAVPVRIRLDRTGPSKDA